MEKNDLAIPWLQQAVEIDPNYQEAYYWLFQLYRRLGKNEAAEVAVNKFKELSRTPTPKR
jgi:Tfp pilus assembly protein PilF